MSIEAVTNSTVDASQHPLLELSSVVKHFPASRGRKVHSVDGISLTVRKGEVLGLVGESGCGKSTLARTMLRTLKLSGGTISYDGEDIADFKGKRLHDFRSTVQFVFQDPYGALDPRMKLGVSLETPLRHHGMNDKEDRRARMLAMLDRVGLDEGALGKYPRECSGGQLQRLIIARALLLKPQFLICDEPTSALDASIRAQILNLLVELKDELGLTLVMISHDLRVIRYLCDRVAVMYLGKIVEVATRDEMFSNPRHPYSKVLLAAALAEDEAEASSDSSASRLTGEPPSPLDPPTGCRFNPRCPIVQDRCRSDEPALLPIGPEHTVACHYWDS